ncbi:MAG: hypothetical protein BRD30_00590, partial [Bacteroidetes bacterium QH_2_63_10]
VRVKLVMKLPKEWQVPASPLAVPSSLTRWGMSEVVNHLLGGSSHTAFDFLAGGDFSFLPGQAPPLRRPENGLTRVEGDYKFFGESNVPVDEIRPTGDLHLFRDDFSYPRVLRTSLAYDQSLPSGFIATLEGQWSPSTPTATPTPTPTPTPTASPTPTPSPTRTAGTADEPSLAAGGGRPRCTYNVTARLRKQTTEVWDGGSIRGNISYSYGDARSLNTYNGDTAGSLWADNAHVEGTNNLTLGRSPFSQGHRVQSTVGFQQELTGNVSANLSLYYSGTSGRPFSYTIDSDPEEFPGDDGGPALMYIPEEVSDLRLTPIMDGNGNVARSVQQQRQDLQRFIDNVDYLSENRGSYAERNGDRTPFEGVIDLKFSLDFGGELLGRTQRLSLMADVFNFSSLLGEIFGTDWGLRYLQAGGGDPPTIDVLRFDSFEDPDGDGNPTPVYQSDLGSENVDRNKEDLFNVRSGTQTYSSLYQVQLGIKYTF